MNGGTVTANGDRYAAGIGGGLYGNGGTVTISGGTVHANGGNIGEGAGIGGGSNGNGGTVTISGGIVTAVGGWAGADIGAGRSNFTYLNGGTLTVSGNTLLDADKFENNGGDKTLVTILGGVVRDGNTYTVHGTVLLLDDTLTLGANQTLHIPDGATLVISELAAHPTSTVTGPGRLFRLDQLPPPPPPPLFRVDPLNNRGGGETTPPPGPPPPTPP
ncbi:MAG: hypothetical protein FWH21_03880, partial [Kiritimatiellaeota bacterium]|nr:hypothetical protein [Kiritimatiellota bacterium]